MFIKQYKKIILPGNILFNPYFYSQKTQLNNYVFKEANRYVTVFVTAVEMNENGYFH